MKIKELREILDNFDDNENFDIVLDIPNTECYITDLKEVRVEADMLIFEFDVRYSVSIEVY